MPPGSPTPDRPQRGPTGRYRYSAVTGVAVRTLYWRIASSHQPASAPAGSRHNSPCSQISESASSSRAIFSLPVSFFGPSRKSRWRAGHRARSSEPIANPVTRPVYRLTFVVSWNAIFEKHRSLGNTCPRYTRVCHVHHHAAIRISTLTEECAPCLSKIL